ncbi:MAG TPA: tripartite tricarboxylate transporter substrate binding protein [Burkholderiales bacterium]|nr:tripartite tricarboxylate transporter substrate binding protein [Burkholderiales bacterium]
MRATRRSAGARAAALALLLIAGATAHAQGAAAGYPAKPVRLIVPFTSGGPGDSLARIIAPKLAEVWGQQLVIDNRGGANSIVGTELGAHAAPDGYTLLMITASFCVNVSLYPKLPYDSVKDFAPVSMVAVGPNLLVAHPSLPVRSVKELIAYARTRPGALSYASSGSGSPSNLDVELIKTMAGIDLVHVPYKSMAPGMTDLLGGQVQLAMPTISAAVPFVRAGRLNALGVSTARRSPALPEVPTIAEAALPGYEAANWYAIVAPAATPRAIVARLNADLVRVLGVVDVRERMAAGGMEAQSMDSAAFGKHIHDEIAKWAKVVAASRAKPD